MPLSEKDFTSRAPMRDGTLRVPTEKQAFARPISGGRLWTHTEAFIQATTALEDVEAKTEGYGQRLHALGAWMALRILRATWDTGIVVDGSDTSVASCLGVSRPTWAGWRRRLETAGLLRIGVSGCQIPRWSDLEGRQSDGTHVSGGNAVTDRAAAADALNRILAVAESPGSGGAPRAYAAWGAWWVLVICHMKAGGVLGRTDGAVAETLGTDRRSWQRLSELLKCAGLIEREGTTWKVCEAARPLHARRPERARRQATTAVDNQPVAAANVSDIPAANLDTDDGLAPSTRAYTRADVDSSKPSPTPHDTTPPVVVEPNREGSTQSPYVAEVLEGIAGTRPDLALIAATSGGLRRAVRAVSDATSETSPAQLVDELVRDLESAWNPIGVMVKRARELADELQRSAAIAQTLFGESPAGVVAEDIATRIEARRKLENKAVATRHRDAAAAISFELDDEAVIDLASRVEPSDSTEVMARRIVAWAVLAVELAGGAGPVADRISHALASGWHPEAELVEVPDCHSTAETNLAVRLRCLQSQAA